MWSFLGHLVSRKKDMVPSEKNAREKDLVKKELKHV
jgi:hypothetical protein